jgi:hypothetical protein
MESEESEQRPGEEPEEMAWEASQEGPPDDPRERGPEPDETPNEDPEEGPSEEAHEGTGGDFFPEGNEQMPAPKPGDSPEIFSGYPRIPQAELWLRAMGNAYKEAKVLGVVGPPGADTLHLVMWWLTMDGLFKDRKTDILRSSDMHSSRGTFEMLIDFLIQSARQNGPERIIVVDDLDAQMTRRYPNLEPRLGEALETFASRTKNSFCILISSKPFEPITKHPRYRQIDLRERPEKIESEPSAATSSKPEVAVESPLGLGHAQAIGEKPATEDRLGRRGLVKSLAAMLGDPSQQTPLTLALLGDWGSGKTTVMELLAAKLKKSQSCRFSFATFNAWQYQLTGNMPASLAQEVVKGFIEGTRVWKLPLVLSPIYWAVFGSFVLRRHLIKMSLLIAAPILAGVIAFRPDRFDVLKYLKDTHPEIFTLFNFNMTLVVFWSVLAYCLWKAKEVLEHPLFVDLKTYLQLPSYNAHLGLTPVLREDVHTFAHICLGGCWPNSWNRRNRLVVFVDDLDRCNHTCIAETFDAIRLIMDVEDIIVIIGIDHRIALRAMTEQFKEVSGATHSPSEIARDYLAKIIQLPIRLPIPAAEDYAGFITERLFGTNAKVKEDDSPNTPVEAELHRNRDRISTAGQSPVPSPAESVPTGGSNPRGPNEQPVPTPPVSVASNDPDLHKVMNHSNEEAEWFRICAAAFKVANPRQLIRLFNSYSLLKLFDAFRCSGRSTAKAWDPFRLMRMLFLQDVLHGLPPKWNGLIASAVIDPRKIDREWPKDKWQTARELSVLMRTADPEQLRAGHTNGAHGTLDADFDSLAAFVNQMVLPCADAPKGGTEA